MTRGARLTWLALVAAGCTVPIDLVDSESIGGSGSAEGAGASDGDNPPLCEVGTQDCPCDGDTCDTGLACADSVCVPLTGDCGNGTIDADEDCDDGNLTDADGCNADCSPSSELQWMQSVQASRGNAIAVDSTDSIVVAGRDITPGDNGGWVLKLERSGATIWNQPLPPDTYPNDVATGPGDAIFVGCGYFPPGGFGFGGYWARTFGPDGEDGQVIDENWDEAVAVAVTADGTLVSGGTNRLYAHQPAQSWYWEPNERVVNLNTAPDGGFTLTTGVDVVDSQVFKYPSPDPGGGPQWVVEAPGEPGATVVDAAGNVVVVGKSTYQANEIGWLLELAPDGSQLWQRDVDFGESKPVGLAVDTHGRITIGRTTENGYALTKHDTDGQPLWSPDPVDGYELREIAVNSHDEVVAVGTTDGPMDLPSMWIGSFSP